MKILLISILILLTYCESENRKETKPVTDIEDNNKEYPGALHYSNELFVYWADTFENYTAGLECDAQFQTPEKALGMATGKNDDIVCLGRGGEITFVFIDNPVSNGDGEDFAVFENAFSDTFLELAFVEVSSDGENFFRFSTTSITREPVDSFGSVEFSNVYDLNEEYTGFAGVHPASYGTLFDIDDLPENELLNKNRITHIKLVDIPGDGSLVDSKGNPIFDPFPCRSSAGFDCDAVGIINTVPTD
jgi:hypothetical protein